MTHTINFRRSLCLLLACLVLCFSVLRPVTVYATGVEGAAMAGFVGIAPEVAVPIILALLGVAFIGSQWDQICEWVSDAIEDFTVEIDGDLYISGYEYAGNTYIDNAVVNAVASSVVQYNEAIYSEAWRLGQDYRYMYTIKFTANREAVVWTNERLTVTNDGSYTIFTAAGDWVSYYANKAGTNPYNEIFDSRTVANPGTQVFSFSNTIYDTYSISDLTAVLDPSVTYGETVAVTNPVTKEEEIAIPIAPSTSVPATKTEEEVEVITSTDTGTGSTTVDLSGILGWLQKIWIAITELVSGITSPITTAVNTGVQTIKDAIASVKTGVISLVDFFTGTAYVASPLEAIHFGSLFDLFPFNIPAGIVETVRFWGATAAAPTITIPLPTISGGSADIYKFEINLSEIPGMDKLAAIIRAGELILFVVGLVILTEKVTKW